MCNNNNNNRNCRLIVENSKFNLFYYANPDVIVKFRNFIVPTNNSMNAATKIDILDILFFKRLSTLKEN